MASTRSNKFKKGEIETNGTSSIARFNENSPLFREYGPQEVKQSPMFASKGTSKYGSSLPLMNDNASKQNSLKKLPSSRASFSGTFTSYNKRNYDHTVSPQQRTKLLGSSSSSRSVCQAPNRKAYSENFNDMVSQECENVVQASRGLSVRTRQPPQTRLESLGSTHTWILLFLPSLSAILVLFIHPYCVSTTEFSFETCAAPYHCVILPSSSVDEFGTTPDILRILLKRSVASVNFIDVSMNIDHFAISRDVIDASDRKLSESNSTDSTYAIRTRLFTVRSEYLQDLSGSCSKGDKCNDDSLYDMTTYGATVILDTTTIYKYVSLSHTNSKSNEGFKLLDAKSLSRTGYLHGGNRYPVMDISITQITPENLLSLSEKRRDSFWISKSSSAVMRDNLDYSASNLDYSASNLDYSASNLDYSAANLDYSASNLDYSAANLDYSASNLDLSVPYEHSFEVERTETTIEIPKAVQTIESTAVRTDSSFSKEEITVEDMRISLSSESHLFSLWSAVFMLFLSIVSCTSLAVFFFRAYSHVFRCMKNKSGNSYFVWANFLLPEQFTGFGLLFALICWLNPLSAVLKLLSILNEFVSVPDSWDFASKLIESLGRQGKVKFTVFHFFTFFSLILTLIFSSF
jgi:hypothetical protein